MLAGQVAGDVGQDAGVMGEGGGMTCTAGVLHGAAGGLFLPCAAGALGGSRVGGSLPGMDQALFYAAAASRGTACGQAAALDLDALEPQDDGEAQHGDSHPPGPGMAHDAQGAPAGLHQSRTQDMHMPFPSEARGSGRTLFLPTPAATAAQPNRSCRRWRTGRSEGGSSAPRTCIWSGVGERGRAGKACTKWRRVSFFFFCHSTKIGSSKLEGGALRVRGSPTRPARRARQALPHHVHCSSQV